MNAFQILGLLAAAAFVAVTIWRLGRHRLGTLAGLGWIAVWSAAAVAIAYPEITVVAAGVLGIQRGADLVFYVAILGGLAGFYGVLSRLRRIDRDLTVLTRRLALHEAPPRPGGEEAAGVQAAPVPRNPPPPAGGPA